jgi:hypothetical protein
MEGVQTIDNQDPDLAVSEIKKGYFPKVLKNKDPCQNWITTVHIIPISQRISNSEFV